MKKAVITIVVTVLVLALIAIVGRDAIVGALLKRGMKATTGLELMVEDVDVGLFDSSIKVDNLILFNPAGYKERTMVEIPELFLNYDLSAVLRGKLHFRKMKLDLRRLSIIKDGKGRVNVACLKGVRTKGERAKREEVTTARGEERRDKAFKIDRLELRVGRITYRDYTPGAPFSKLELDLNTHDVFDDITSPGDVVEIILARAVMRTAIADLAGIDFMPVQPDMAEALRKGIKAIDEALKKLGEKMKLPIGE